jgi:hypothetical protein
MEIPKLKGAVAPSMVNWVDDTAMVVVIRSPHAGMAIPINKNKMIMMMNDKEIFIILEPLFFDQFAPKYHRN